MTIILSSLSGTTPLASYAQLVASAAAWAHRSDLDALMPDFVALAEAAKHFAVRSKFAGASGKGAQKEIVMPKREGDTGGFIGWELLAIGEFQEIAQRKRVRGPDLLLDKPDFVESHSCSAVQTLKTRNEGR